ncbi:hypothetical protein [Pilimelia anulata]|uniref:hypothetical protein n=1 Tax=Pilimelia anulata TaxID=53371 RepID=UPI001669A627|nr:hypothetical protein [Pilimelia anulata]
MRQLDLIEALQMWISGQSIADHRLGWWTVRTWGRVGKVLQFLGALTVVAELAGPERVRRLGARVRDSVPLAGLVALAAAVPLWVAAIARYPRYAEGIDRLTDTVFARVYPGVVCPLLMLVVVFLMVFGESIGSTRVGHWIASGLALILLLWAVPFLLVSLLGAAGMLVVVPVFGIALCTTAVRYGLQGLVIVPTAWLLEREGKRVQWAGVLLLVLGFLLDMLAS